jgi:hypothetical protein
MRSIIAIATAASSRDLTTVERLKAVIGETAQTDERLQGLITQASVALETFCRRILAKQRYVETFRLPHPVESLVLRQYPVTVASVVEDGVALDADDWECDGETGELRRLNSDLPQDWCANKIVVTFDGGYVLPSFTDGETGTSLPDDLEWACQQLAKIAQHNDSRDTAILRETVPEVFDVTYAAPGGNAMPLVEGLPEEIAGRVLPYQAKRV